MTGLGLVVVRRQSPVKFPNPKATRKLLPVCIWLLLVIYHYQNCNKTTIEYSHTPIHTMPPILDAQETFASLAESVGLDGRLRKALMRLGHVRPTLVQSKCLPLAISAGRNLLVRARTGSGKTLAYALPVLQKVLQRPPTDASVSAIILVPTRELCAQVAATLEQLTYYCDDRVQIAVLGSASDPDDLERQDARLRDQPAVIVATPKALWTHLVPRKEKPHPLALLNCSALDMLVLDEADLMLSLGYQQDVTEILPHLPRTFQGLLLSATLPAELEFFKQQLQHPVRVTLEEEEGPDDHDARALKQFYLCLPGPDKRLLLYVFLKLGLLKGKGLFFVNTTDAGYRWKLFFEQFHIRSAVLNAELPFASRRHILEQFNVGNVEYLIATDASTDARVDTPRKRPADAAYGVSRGLDFRHVSFVVNVDLPPHPVAYAHRIGRTARAGAPGVALTLVDGGSAAERALLQAIQETQPRVPRASSDTFSAADNAADDDDPLQPQPGPLDFSLASLEGFRYRVEDVGRAVTKGAVRETRAAEFRAEVVNSARLQAHFAAHPGDWQLLAHDRVATRRVQAHLQHVPSYLLPRGMHVAHPTRRRKKKRVRRGQERRCDNDPLQTLEVDLDDYDGIEVDDPQASFWTEEDGTEEDGAQTTAGKKRPIVDDVPVFQHPQDGTGATTAGRAVWKEKHRKGKFSSKKRLSERKHKAPLGI
jgi:ATP-dependent RNA helicase DDX56/DBP9